MATRGVGDVGGGELIGHTDGWGLNASMQTQSGAKSIASEKAWSEQ
jgi:hypothetical protein